MIHYMHPHLESIETSYNGREIVKYIDIGSKPILQILKGGSDTWDTVELTRDTKKYFNIKVMNYDKQTDAEGKKRKDSTTHEFVQCTEQYMASIYEARYLKNKKKRSSYLYCIEDKAIEL